MEDITQALLLSFAVLTLVIALTVSINTFSQARQTSDLIIRRADATTTTEYEDIESLETPFRIVGNETIIPNLYRYSKENLRIVFMQGSLSDDKTLTIGDPLQIYQTKSNPNTWLKFGYKEDEPEPGTKKEAYGHKLSKNVVDGDETKICSFDISEEQARNEHWVNGDPETFREDITNIINGRETGYYKPLYIFQNNPGAQYAELISRETEKSGNKTTKKTTITYVKIH